MSVSVFCASIDPMATANRSEAPADLHSRLSELGRSLGEREAAYAPALQEAHRRAVDLHHRVSDGLAAFGARYAESGATPIAIALSEPRLDDKHVRSVQLELRRGRHVAIITVKSRGDVTLVGPFHAGKSEGPCQSIPWQSQPELDLALVAFLERFLEQALTP